MSWRLLCLSLCCQRSPLHPASPPQTDTHACTRACAHTHRHVHVTWLYASTRSFPLGSRALWVRISLFLPLILAFSIYGFFTGYECLWQSMEEGSGVVGGMVLEGMELLLLAEHYRRSPEGERALRLAHSRPSWNRGGVGVRRDLSASWRQGQEEGLSSWLQTWCSFQRPAGCPVPVSSWHGARASVTVSRLSGAPSTFVQPSRAERDCS